MFYLKMREMVDFLNSMSYDDEIPKQTEQEVGNRSFSPASVPPSDCSHEEIGMIS